MSCEVNIRIIVRIILVFDKKKDKPNMWKKKKGDKNIFGLSWGKYLI